jgi:hypothetical protein
MIEWRSAGEGMGTVDLADLSGDQIVIHYGGALNSVDAYTFANSLIEFANTITAVNQAIDPSQSIEVRLEALDKGSFRAVLRRIPKGIGGFFSGGAKEIFWGIIVALIYEKLFANDPKILIKVGADQVVVERGSDRVIIPKVIFENTQTLKKKPEIEKHITKTFEIVAADQAIENFGLTPSVKDKRPLVQFGRDEFPILSLPTPLEEPRPTQRERREKARLLILKAWLKRGPQKWSFEWNGFPISAPIRDQEFFSRLENREFLIGSGDALDVELYYVQEYDEGLGIYVNDPSTFVVEKVIKPISSGVQLKL